MNKLRIFISLIVTTVFLFFFATPVLAADLEVTFESDPLFSQAADGDWYPGRSETRWVTVKNNSGSDKTVITETFNEIATYLEDLADVLELTISSAGTDLYGGSLGAKYLADFYDESELSLTTLPTGQSVTYDFIVTMDESVGNPWQGKDTGFDLKIGFYGVTAPAGLGAGGPAGAPVCTDTKPGIPTGFSAVAGPGAGEVVLSWIPPSPPYTYFLVAYSDASSWPPKWGNPDVGNVNTYTVSGLGSGTYWFWLRAGNGCMPGDFTGPISPGAIVGIPGAVVAPGFAPGVLGVKEEELGEALATEEGEIAGLEIGNVCWWWLILSLAEFGILCVYYWWLSREKRKSRYWWLFALGLAILAFIGDQYFAHRYFTPSQFCRFMWLWASLAALIPTGLYLYFRNK